MIARLAFVFTQAGRISVLGGETSFLVTTKVSTLLSGGTCVSIGFKFQYQQGRLHMQMMDNAVEARVENSIETRKDWSAPELQKIDIEQITAIHVGVTSDGTTGS